MERARRDLENRHGDNVVKMAQASADRLNSTLEAQKLNLGLSQGQGLASIFNNLSPIKADSLANKSSMKLPPRHPSHLRKRSPSPDFNEETFSRYDDDYYNQESPSRYS